MRGIGRAGVGMIHHSVARYTGCGKSNIAKSEPTGGMANNTASLPGFVLRKADARSFTAYLNRL